MAGSLTAVISDIAIEATGISADIAVTADNITRNGVAFMDGSLSGDVTATLATVSGETTIGTLTANLTFSNFSVQGQTINGQLKIVAENFNTDFIPGKITVTMTNLTGFGHTISSGTIVYTAPSSLTVTAQTDMGPVNMNLTFTAGDDFETMTVSTVTTGTVGDYTIDMYNVHMDTTQCEDYPISGDTTVTQGATSYTATFTDACDGTYTLVKDGEDPVDPTASEITGWWWNKDEPGTGISVEEQGDNIYLAWYAYDSLGWPWWYTCLAGKTSEGIYEGKLQEWYGWTLGQTYYLPESADVGTLKVDFTTKGKAKFDWTSNGVSGSVEATKFFDDSFPGSEDSRGLTGWWWDETYAGMGLYFEAQADTFYGAWFFYDEFNLPYWWSFGGTKGDFPNGTKVFNADLVGWFGGAMALGGTYSLPYGETESSISITFNSSTSATVKWNGFTYNLTRFDFKDLTP